MDRRILGLIAVVVAVSGCTDITGGTTSSGSGVKVSEFSINDNTLYPDQEASLNLVIENYDADAEVTDLRIVNTGALKVSESDWKSKCSSGQLPDPINNRPGIMECSWTIQAPSSSELGSFRSKSYAPQLMLRYNASFSNSGKPVKIHAKPGSEIQSPKKVSRSYSNGEVTTKVNFENPTPLELETPMEVVISSNRNHLVSDKYGFSVTPGSFFSSCNGVEATNERVEVDVEVEPNGKARFTCMLAPSSSNTRNLIVSTSYKYQKAPSLSVEVVSQ